MSGHPIWLSLPLKVLILIALFTQHGWEALALQRTERNSAKYPSLAKNIKNTGQDGLFDDLPALYKVPIAVGLSMGVLTMAEIDSICI